MGLDDLWNMVWGGTYDLVNDLAGMIAGWWTPSRNDEGSTDRPEEDAASVPQAAHQKAQNGR